jgi:hypothetical protein
VTASAVAWYGAEYRLTKVAAAYELMVVVFETSDFTLFEMAKSLLKANAIEFMTAKESLQDLIGGGRMGGLNIIAGPAQLSVPESEVERAQELLAELGPDG